MARLEIVTQNAGKIGTGIFSPGYENLLMDEIVRERTNWNNLYAHIIWDDGREETYDFILWRYQNGCGRYPKYSKCTNDENGLTVWKEVPDAKLLNVITPGHTNPTILV